MYRLAKNKKFLANVPGINCYKYAPYSVVTNIPFANGPGSAEA